MCSPIFFRLALQSFFIMSVRFVLFSRIPWAIAESGNMVFITSVKPSTTATGKLCSAIKQQNNIVANATPLGVLWDCLGIYWTANPSWFATWSGVLLCRLIAVTSAATSRLQALQYALLPSPCNLFNQGSKSQASRNLLFCTYCAAKENKSFAVGTEYY